MYYTVYPMQVEDIPQVAEINREAFPTEWPPPSYKRELSNRLAHYLVACDGRQIEGEKSVASSEIARTGLMRRATQSLTSWKRYLFGGEAPPWGNRYIVGFAGFWLMADEAHIVDIAVRQSYHQCVPCFFLTRIPLDLATELNAQIITLEVRVSNLAAQALYEKYGFIKVGTRRGYYLDNKEDAIIMTTDTITSASNQTLSQRLKLEFDERWGKTRCLLLEDSPTK